MGSDQDILILGDSLAYGVGTSSPERSFAGQIGDIFPNHDIINKAEIGDVTQQLADSILEKMDKDYDITFIFVGGNDIIGYGVDLQVSEANLMKIIDLAGGRDSNLRSLVLETDTLDQLSYSSIKVKPLTYQYQL